MSPHPIFLLLERTKRRVNAQRRDKELHFAIVVPDKRAFTFITGRCFAVVPATWKGTVHAHVVLNTKQTDLSWAQRVLLADLQLVSHAELGLLLDIETTLGWPEENR